jgi:hypothetical protein
VVTDHKDLEPIAARAFEDRSGRRARIAEVVARVPFTLKWLPRSMMAAPHALSMTPEFRTSREEERKAEMQRALQGVSVATAKGVVEDTKWLETEATRRSPDVWRKAQERYPPSKDVIYFKEGKSVEGDVAHVTKIAAMAERTTMVGGVLYILYKHKGDWRRLLWIPDVDDLRREAFEKAHAAEGGHRKVAKTYARLLETVYWDNMHSDVVRWISECAVCFLTSKFSSNWGGLQPTTSETLAGRSRVAMDLLGPFPVTERGNSMILVTISYDDGWPTISALPSQDAETVMRAFRKDTVAQSGVPEVVLTDMGSNVTSQVAMDFYDALGIEKKQTAPQSPWSDGMAENLVKEVSHMLRAYVVELGGQWDDHLWLVEMSLRSAERLPYRMSPYEARYGTKMRLPSWFHSLQTEAEPVTVAELRTIKERISRLRDEAAKQMKVSFDKGLEPVPFTVGDWVALKKNDRSSKLDEFKVGPFRVKEKVGDLDVILEEVPNGPNLGQRPALQSVRNLVRYTPTSILKSEEETVKDVIGHEGHGRGRKYLVVWSDNSATWEPRKNLVDSVNGEETIVEALLRYWERNPKLSRKV